MALKMDRQVDAVDVSFFLNDVTSRGKIVCVSTAGSGISLDDPASILTVPANSSGNKPVGVLLNDFVDVDLTRTNLNWHQDQSQVGTKATVLTKGWVVTDQITGTVSAGDIAILSSSGTAAARPAIASYNQAANPTVGRFRSKADEDGFAKLYIDL